MKRVVIGVVWAVAVFGLSGVVSAQERVRNVQDLVGARASGAEKEMERRGYSWVRTEKSGSSAYSYWREGRTNRCVTVRTADGRYQSIVYAPDFDCRGGQGSSGGDWGSGSGGDWGQPSHNRGVTLHRDLNFTGFSETYTKDIHDMRLTRFGDDHATSVSISPGCVARLYRDLDFRGGYTEVRNDIGDLRGSKVGDDSVTSLQVRCGGGGWGGGSEWHGSMPSRAYGVTLHRDLNFTGVSETFTRDVPDMRKTRIGDDHATSVSISPECRARLYEHPNYEGDYTEVNHDIRDLRGSRVGNDSITSLQVRCN